MADASDIQAQLLDVFFEECDEGLGTVESGFLELDVDDPDPEQINLIFRALHSIKGSSGSFGFTTISEFAHHAETLLDEIRAGERGLTSEIVNLFLKSGDHIRSMVEAARDGGEVDETDTQSLTAAFKRILEDGAGTADASAGSESGPAADDEPSEITWKIAFAPDGSILQTGNDPIRILRSLAELGPLEIETDLSALPGFGELDPEACYARFDLRLTTAASEEEIREVFAWVEDECTLDLAPEAPTSVVAGSDSPSAVEATASAAPATAAPEKASAKAPARSGADSNKGSTSIRVSTDKVDALINMVGELVIIQSMLSDIGENPDPSKMPKLREGLAQLQNNTRELQERVMRIRMLPISFAFNRFPRLVHDLSEQLALVEKTNLVTQG